MAGWIPRCQNKAKANLKSEFIILPHCSVQMQRHRFEWATAKRSCIEGTHTQAMPSLPLLSTNASYKARRPRLGLGTWADFTPGTQMPPLVHSEIPNEGLKSGELAKSAGIVGILEK